MNKPIDTHRPARGFTLIELMIAVAIVAILASVAYPAYVDYIRRAQLPEGQTYLSDYRVKLEQYYQDHRNYGALGTTACANETPPSWATFAPSSAKFFTFSCALSSNANNQGYVLTATGNHGRAVGHDYTLNHDNVKSTTKFKGVTSTKPCWLVKGTEC